VLAYDAVQVIVAGLRALGRLQDAGLASGLGETRHRLREAIAAARLTAATGRVRFDAHGDRVHGVALYAVEAGEAGPRPRLRGWLGER
jgi:ABC-type branched-subunit amino acid transport system substrate-binding protein